MEIQLISFGATITSVKIPDNQGHTDDVVLGYDTLSGDVCYLFSGHFRTERPSLDNKMFDRTPPFCTLRLLSCS